MTFINHLKSRSKTHTTSPRSEAGPSARNLVRNYVSVRAALIVSMLSFTPTAQSTDLIDIRTGFHRTYSRVVIQFDSDVKFQVIKDFENGSIIIDVLNVNAVRNFGKVNLDQKELYLKQVSFKRSPNLLSITTILKMSNLRVDHYYLNWPFRIVLDIYPSSILSEKPEISEKTLQSEPQPDEQMLIAAAPQIDSLQSVASDSVASDSVESSEVDSLTLSSARIDSLAGEIVANYDSTTTLLRESIIPLQSSLKSVKSELQKIAKKRNAEWNQLMSKYTLASLLVAAFVLIDLIWVALYFVRRSKKRKHAVQTRESVAKKQPVEKQTNREFVEILKSTLESNEIEEIRIEPEVIRKNDFFANTQHAFEPRIRSFSEPINARKEASLSPPELAEVARDLGSILPSSRVAKEVTREELIGRDGVEFLKNLQRQSLN
ncbi:hypothetical protein IID10_18685 [candidate division KSB1 bacterium]|nr:hypothetical protein [candidate division KSB1 bacterium]